MANTKRRKASAKLDADESDDKKTVKLGDASGRKKLIDAVKNRHFGNITAACDELGIARPYVYEVANSEGMEQFKADLDDAVDFGKRQFSQRGGRAARQIVMEELEHQLSLPVGRRDPKKVDLYSKRLGEITGEFGSGSGVNINMGSGDGPRQIKSIKHVPVSPDKRKFEVDTKALREQRKAEAYDRAGNEQIDTRDIDAARAEYDSKPDGSNQH